MNSRQKLDQDGQTGPKSEPKSFSLFGQTEPRSTATINNYYYMEGDKYSIKMGKHSKKLKLYPIKVGDEEMKHRSLRDSPKDK